MTGYVDGAGLAAWVAEHTDVDQATAAAVLALEDDYLMAAGLMSPANDDYTFRYYQPGQPPLGTGHLAGDVERLLGIPAATAHVVFEAELRFMEMRGLA